MTEDTANLQGVGYKRPPKDKQFERGDPRINRNGRPTAFDTLRKMARRIAEATDPDQELRNVERILTDWAHSKVFEKQKQLLELAYGKVPNAPIELPTNLNVKG